MIDIKKIQEIKKLKASADEIAKAVRDEMYEEVDSFMSQASNLDSEMYEELIARLLQHEQFFATLKSMVMEEAEYGDRETSTKYQISLRGGSPELWNSP